MKATHKLKIETDVVAWQYTITAPRPIWVCRKWHKLDNADELTALSDGLEMIARPGDWIVYFIADERHSLWSAAAFKSFFTAIPPEEKQPTKTNE